jgi:hypothetical protein
MRWRKRCESSAQHCSVSLEEELMIQQLIQPTRLCELLSNPHHVCVPSPIKFTIPQLAIDICDKFRGTLGDEQGKQVHSVNDVHIVVDEFA